MDYSELLRHVDHTLLTPTATWDQVKTVCDEGLTCRTASVCIPPRYVKRAAAYVGNQLKICTVVGFPTATPLLRSRCSRPRTPSAGERTRSTWWLIWAW